MCTSVLLDRKVKINKSHPVRFAYFCWFVKIYFARGLEE